jgi:hypothetical protein
MPTLVAHARRGDFFRFAAFQQTSMRAAPEMSKSLMYEQLQRNHCRASGAVERDLQAVKPSIAKVETSARR